MSNNYRYNKDNRERQKSIFFDEEVEEALTPQQPKAKAKPAVAADWQIHYASFGSGSSGNCAYLGNAQQGILIDAGVDLKHVFADLKRNGISPNMVKGIILTHDHADHIRYVYRIVREYRHIHVYCTPKLLNGMLRKHNISHRIKEYHEPIFKEIPFKLAGMTITAFEASHDGSDNMGFYIEGGGHRFVVAADMGVITPRADFYMRQAQYLVIESNYDRHMLDAGTYPEILKERIIKPTGHLDNKVTAQFVADIYTPELKYVFLCHLSNDNNTPDIACNEVRSALEAKGVTVGDASNALDQRDKDIQLYALPRYDTSTWFVL